jgi:DNA-binding transcriptional ArsR family regulator
MSDEVILNELRSLRRDLGSMNERFVSMRYEDLKGVFVDEMREALGEQGKQAMRSDLDIVQVVSTCSLRTACMDKLRHIMDAVTGAMEHDDLDTAHRILDETSDLICGGSSPCLDEGCSRSASETIKRARLMLDLYSGLLDKFDSIGPGGIPTIAAKNMVSPEVAERALGPLANGHRLTIMNMLAEEQRTLTEICKRLEMRTGHLQFHMKALRDAGYVASDRRSRMYSLTPKGAKALGSVNEMVAGLVD